MQNSTPLSISWDSLPAELQKEIAGRIGNPTLNGETIWFDGKRIDEFLFAEAYLERHPLIFYAGAFYDTNGRCGNPDLLLKEIADMIRPVQTSHIAKTAERLLNAVRITCLREDLPLHTDRIPVANGTLYTDGRFSGEKTFRRNRLPVSYCPDAKKPILWLRFLSGLLHAEDIPTLQEYMGYVLLPTTKAQKMLLVIGDGGEGKSTLGRVFRVLLGDNMNTGSIRKLETNRFFLSAQEGQLLLMDDDMELEALRNTATLKTLVTMEDKIDIERKGEQSRQAHIYTRIVGFGNGTLKSLYDRSAGLFRRYIILVAKPRDGNRVDDPFLGEKLAEEAEGILLWCFEGLRRLIANNFHFTISEKARENLANAKEDGDNVAAFMRSGGYIRFEAGTSALTRDLFGAYRAWCDNNLLPPLGMKSFASHLRNHQAEYGIVYNDKLKSRDGKDARGYDGLYVPGRYDGWTVVTDDSSFPFD